METSSRFRFWPRFEAAAARRQPIRAASPCYVPWTTPWPPIIWERLCERVVAQACVDYNNAKTEAQLRDEGALAADLARYVAFKESFHAPPSFTAPNKYT